MSKIPIDGIRLGFVGGGKLVHVLKATIDGRSTKLFPICRRSDEREVTPISDGRHLVNVTCKSCLRIALEATWANATELIKQFRALCPEPDADITEASELRRQCAIKLQRVRYLPRKKELRAAEKARKS